MITAVFPNAETFTTVSDDVWQWDYGQILEIQGLPIDETTEVDFATTSKYGEAIPVTGDVVDDAYQVAIPDSVLAAKKYEDYTVYAYTFKKTEDAGETTHCIRIPVKCRPYRVNDSGGGGGTGGGGGGTSTALMYGVCSTNAETAAKTVACEGFTLETGAVVIVRFVNTNTASHPTLNVSDTGARNIYYKGSAIDASVLSADSVYMFVYDGVQYEVIGDVGTNLSITYDETIKALRFDY